MKVSSQQGTYMTSAFARTARTQHSIRQIILKTLVVLILILLILAILCLTVGVQCLLADLRGNHSHADLLEDVGTIPVTKLSVAPSVRLRRLPIECLCVRTLMDDTK